jgi:DNA gyrase/topoisomerase IV subunit A
MEVSVITPEKISEWLKEVEERPTSGSIIIQYIANRLSDLTARNEELLAENIELRSGRKVEEYESRITNLEYQLDLLKRQMGGQAAADVRPDETSSLLIYTPQGEVLRVEFNAAELVSGGTAAGFREGEVSAGMHPRLLATGSLQELLCVFDSGRTQTMPVSAIPSAGPEGLSWRQAPSSQPSGQVPLLEPRGVEELAFLLPIARMALSDFAVQASRRGFVKKIKRSLLENYISKDYIGSGVKLPSDRTCDMAFCNESDLFVMVSREGFLFSMPAADLPFSVEEALRLGMADHIVSAFAVNPDPAAGGPELSILVVTQTGKVVTRNVSWLEPAGSFKSHGQPVFSKERRSSGVRVAAAALANEADWGLALSSDGKIAAHMIADLLGSGTLPVDQPSGEILGFSVLSSPKSRMHK